MFLNGATSSVSWSRARAPSFVPRFGCRGAVLGSRRKRCEKRWCVPRRRAWRLRNRSSGLLGGSSIGVRPPAKSKPRASVLLPLASVDARRPYALARAVPNTRQRTRHHFDAGFGIGKVAASPGRSLSRRARTARGGDAAAAMAGGPKTNNGGGAAKPKRVVLTKNQKKRLKKKEKRAAAASEPAAPPVPPPAPPKKENVVVEYVSAAYDADAAASLFKDVFAKFASAEELTTDTVEEVATDAPVAEKADDVEEDEAPEKRLSRKQRKAMSRMTVAELKQVVARPEAVEAHDVTASDPRLLVFLKSYRNTVPVPRHWCHKRKFLQGKRGVEKKPFQLPEYIAQTGLYTSVIFVRPTPSTRRWPRGRVGSRAWRERGR